MHSERPISKRNVNLGGLAPRSLPPLAGAALASHDQFEHAKMVGEDLAGRHLEFFGLKEVLMQGVCLAGTRFVAPRLDTVRLEACDLANADWSRLIAHRVEFIGCRMDGFSIPEAFVQDVRFQECSLQFARIRFATLKSAEFDHCDLGRADLQATDLTGTIFTRCNLNEVEFSQATLAGADLRTCTIERIHVGIAELAGAIVDHFQAAYLAGLMGLVIKAEDEP